MKPRLIIAGILLAVAVLTFAGLAYQKVPVSNTITITQESTEGLVSYAPFMVSNVITYTTWTYASGFFTAGTWWEYGCYYNIPGEPCSVFTMIYQNITNETAESTSTTLKTATIPYSQTLTSSITESSTSSVPAYATVGLTNTTFEALSILVIVVLIATTIWVALKSRVHQPNQATVNSELKKVKQATVKSFCIECGKELPPKSKFCNKCGAKVSE